MIYIVDDDESVRRGFSMLFKSAGLDHENFASAEDFITAFQLHDNDILILDMHMPGMNGCDLLQYLSKQEIFLPVIIITAYDEPQSRDYARHYGAIAYLRKPVDGEALIDMIKYSVNPV